MGRGREWPEIWREADWLCEMRREQTLGIIREPETNVE